MSCIAVHSPVPNSVKQQYEDNCKWIREAGKHQLVSDQYNSDLTCVVYRLCCCCDFVSSNSAWAQVVGSQARILYSNEEGRVAIALAFNKAIADGRLKVSVCVCNKHVISIVHLQGPVVISRDHHDVSGTDR